MSNYHGIFDNNQNNPRNPNRQNLLPNDRSEELDFFISTQTMNPRDETFGEMLKQFFPLGNRTPILPFAMLGIIVLIFFVQIWKMSIK